jgi:hypothetical protein
MLTNLLLLLLALGSAGDASVTVVYGGEMLVGGEMRVVAGNGGNASNPEDGAGYSGSGGAGSIGVINSGSINVAGNLLVSSGSSGHSARAGGAYEAVVAMVRHSHTREVVNSHEDSFQCALGTLFNFALLLLRRQPWVRAGVQSPPTWRHAWLL